MGLFLVLALVCLASGFPGQRVLAGGAPVLPLPRAHSHNDYEHARPLLDALDQGFCSVEADIYCIHGQLLVAHDRSKTQPERTLQALYLDPLLARVRTNGGRVHPAGPEFHLLIDFKTDAQTTWPVLREALRRYEEMLTVFRASEVRRRAVTVILSGNSPRAILESEPSRFAAIDGRLPDLEGQASPFLVPWISDNWTAHFRWRASGPIADEERERLRALVAQAHAQGRKVRFWGMPDTPLSWKEQFDAGVDFINTDHLAELRQFLGEYPP